MAAPAFGFSVGDFIAGAKLVKSFIDALDDSSGARPAYNRLVHDLRTLDKALDDISAFSLDPSQAAQQAALQQVAAQCHESISVFLSKNAKFAQSWGLQLSQPSFGWRTQLHKIQWAVFKDDAVEALRAEIIGHTTTINLILGTVQMASICLQANSLKSLRQDIAALQYQERDTQVIARQSEDLLKSQTDLIMALTKSVSATSTQQHIAELQSTAHNVLQANMKMFSTVLEIQEALHKQIPPQVYRQQPVYFEDALGRISPFHIEFIGSFKAFQAVLEIRFDGLPGLAKVQELEYQVTDTKSETAVDLKEKPWESQFLPGRKMNMSMIFNDAPPAPLTTCPGCHMRGQNQEANLQGEVQCTNENCKMWYRRLSYTDPSETGRKSRRTLQHNYETLTAIIDNPDYDRWAEDRKKQCSYETIHQFQRVHALQATGYEGIDDIHQTSFLSTVPQNQSDNPESRSDVGNDNNDKQRLFLERNSGPVIMGSSAVHGDLDRRYMVQPSSTFKPGQIFKILWSEPYGSSQKYPAKSLAALTEQTTRENQYGEKFFIGIRRLIVTATYEDHSICVPILTYKGKGCKRKGVRPQTHGIIHPTTRSAAPLKGEPILGFPPVQMRLYVLDEHFAKESRVNYSKLVTVEHNVKIHFIGFVVKDCLDIMNEAIDKCWHENHRRRKGL